MKQIKTFLRNFWETRPPTEELIGSIIVAIFVIAMAQNLFAISPPPIPAAQIPPELPVPVSVNIPYGVWLAWIVSIGMGLSAMLVIGRFIGKLAGLINDVTKYHTVIVAIAQEFKSDSGSTLRDSINRIEKATERAESTANSAKLAVEHLTKMAQKVEDRHES